MYDLQLVFPVATINLTSVSKVPGTDPVVLDVQGEDFRAVEDVRINNISTQYIVFSDTRLRTVLPTGVTLATLENVEVTSAQLTLTKESLLQFRLPARPTAVSGVLKLAQLFLKILLTTPGTDIFNPLLGGGALQNLGRTFARHNSTSILGDVHIAVDRTSRQIMAMQSRQTGLPQDEKLLSAQIVGKRFDSASGTIFVAIELVNQLNRNGQLNIEL